MGILYSLEIKNEITFGIICSAILNSDIEIIRHEIAQILDLEPKNIKSGTGYDFKNKTVTIDFSEGFEPQESDILKRTNEVSGDLIEEQIGKSQQ